MTSYNIALFIHIVAVMVAAGATAATKIAAGRRASAKTVGEVLDWHNVLASASKLFPLCLAAFVGTGFYMLNVANMAVWSNGFVVAGITGVVLLFASGTFLGIKGNALKEMLEQLATRGPNQPAPKLVPPRLVAALPLINTAISLAVVFDMAVKPSVPVALGAIALSIGLGALPALIPPSTEIATRRSRVLVRAE